MNASFIALGNEARAYATASLADGLSLARKAITRVSQMTIEALVPGEVSADRVRDFRHGGLGQLPLGILADMLIERYQHATLIIELPLWRRGDPGLTDCSFTILFCDDELYASTHLHETEGRVEEVLRAADPAFMYNAFVVKGGGSESLSGCPAKWLDEEDAVVAAVIVGAYDGEGFILATESGERAPLGDMLPNAAAT